MTLPFLQPHFLRRPLARTIVAAALFCGPQAPASLWQWTNFDGLWSDAGLWAPASVPVSATTTELAFGGVGATPYTSTFDLAVPFDLHRLTLSSSASVREILGGAGTLAFVPLGAESPILEQNGSGAFQLDLALVTGTVGHPLTLTGSGGGLVTLTGVLSGSGGLHVASGNWQLVNPASTFAGGVTIDLGAFLELAPGTFSESASINLGPGAARILGNSTDNPITIDGGRLKLTTAGLTAADGSAGAIRFANSMNGVFPLTFGTRGGVLDLTNPEVPDAFGNAGTIGSYNGAAGMVVPGGLLNLTLNNTDLAVVRWNGGALGLSDLKTFSSPEWASELNALRLGEMTGSGPVRFELTNGALLRANAGPGPAGNLPAPLSYAAPITYRGVPGGDPIFGNTGNPSTTTTTGRVIFDKIVLTYEHGVTFDGALQVVALSGPSTIDGNIVLAGTSGGAAAQVVFAGRTTGSGTPVASAHVLSLGTLDGDDTMRVEDGAVGILNARIRADFASHHGVQLNAQTILEAGGTLRVTQSISNYSSFVPLSGALASVGDIVLKGPIEGRGTSLKEAVLDLQLPTPMAGGTIQNGVPTPLGSAGMRPFGGMTAASDQRLIINGSGLGGLRIVAEARPNSLFSQNAPDPTSNLTKLKAYLTADRLAAITGSGGYLTAAPLGETWTFPSGGEWSAAVPVGLRISNHHPTGTDVQFEDGQTTFVHNLVVDSGATLDLGFGPFIYGPASATAGLGTLQGKGTIVALGGVTASPGSRIAPGLGGVRDFGTLTIGSLTIQGLLEMETAVGVSDRLVVLGDLEIGGSRLVLPASNIYGTTDYTLATYTGNLSGGAFMQVDGLPAKFAVDYSFENEIRLRYLARQLVWNVQSGVWDKASANWLQSGVPAIFEDSDEVTFNDPTPGANHVVTIAAGGVGPNKVTVDSPSDYTLDSTLGALGGPAGIVKNGPGTLFLKGSASFQGGITITGGKVQTLSSEAIPDVGLVTVETNGQLVLGGTETIDSLTVRGSATTAFPLTVTNLSLDHASVFHAAVTLLGALSKTGAPLTLSEPLNLGGGTRTVTVAADTAPELTIAGQISAGGLRKEGEGTLVLTNPGNDYAAGTTVQAGILQVGAIGALPAASPVQVGAAGTLDLNSLPATLGTLAADGRVLTGGAPLTVSQLTGGTSGLVQLGAGSLIIDQAADTVYSGAFAGTGAVTKKGLGQLTLNGTSSWGGGIVIDEGAVRLTTSMAAGTGTLTVNPNGTLILANYFNSPILLQGGTLGGQPFVLPGHPLDETEDPLTIGAVTLAAQTSSKVLLGDPLSPSVASEIIFLGPLRGSGTLAVQAANDGKSADVAFGLRLRGTVDSDFSGTIVVGERAKFELQGKGAGPFSPAGTGKIVMTAGTLLAKNAGTYSQLNLRNVISGDTTIGNDVEIAGLGAVNFGPVGTVGGDESGLLENSKIILGNLKISGGQTVAANKNSGKALVVQFDSVTLTGGPNGELAGFMPKTPPPVINPLDGFGGTAHLALGPISETVPGSGWEMTGLGTLTLLAPNAYSGPTVLQRGRTVLAASGALPATTDLILLGGVLEFQSGSSANLDQTVKSLSGSGGSIENSDAVNPYRNLTVNQASDTTFDGGISGRINMIKQGSGTLQLRGASSYDGTTTIAGGTLDVGIKESPGFLFSAMQVQGGATLAGYGHTGDVSVAAGGTLSPGGGIGLLSVGHLSLAAGSIFAVELDGLEAGDAYDQLTVAGTVTLQGNVALVLSLGYQPSLGDTFSILLNDGSDLLGGGGLFTYAGNLLADNSSFTVHDGAFSQVFEIHYRADGDHEVGESPNDVVLSAVPEPATGGLLLGGLACLLGRRRRRQ